MVVNRVIMVKTFQTMVILVVETSLQTFQVMGSTFEMIKRLVRGIM